MIFIQQGITVIFDFLFNYLLISIVPIDITNGIQVLYIFVDIQIDLNHLIETIKLNFDSQKRLALVSTIQFASSIHVNKMFA